MPSCIKLALIWIPMSLLIGCNFIQAAQKPVKFYEGQEQPREEIALLNFCNLGWRPFPGGLTITIDGKDAYLHIYSQATDRARGWGALGCRVTILPGEHEVYYSATGSAWPGASFKGVVDFKAGKTYYFMFDGCNFCSPRRTSAWLEDEGGNVVAGTKFNNDGISPTKPRRWRKYKQCSAEHPPEKVAEMCGQYLQTNGSVSKPTSEPNHTSHHGLADERVRTEIYAHRSDEELRAAAEQGAKACQGEADIALQHYFGLTQTDPTAALRWLCKSADQGHPEARHRLALIYENGTEGFEKDLVKAYMWYVLAGESGMWYELAGEPGTYWGGKQALRLKRTLLSPEELAEARKAVEEWRPGQCDIGINSKQSRDQSTD